MPDGVFSQVREAIQKYGVRFLTEDELNERFTAVFTTYSTDTGYFEQPATVSELLFCYDGPH
jgi:hypothetical protein